MNYLALPSSSGFKGCGAGVSGEKALFPEQRQGAQKNQQEITQSY